jgi:AcrR family transcriptional regulator
MNHIQPTDKSNIKKQRIKTYFVDATKEIIRNEGVEKVSVRRVAETAGYSYATIYNYFTHLDDLLQSVKGIMVFELIDLLQKKTENYPNDVEGLKKMLRTYMEYFYENPNVFRFFFFAYIRYQGNSPEGEAGGPDFNVMWRRTLTGLVNEGKLKEEHIENFAKTMIYSMHGMLTLSLSGNGNLSVEEAIKDLDNIIDYLL